MRVRRHTTFFASANQCLLARSSCFYLCRSSVPRPSALEGKYEPFTSCSLAGDHTAAAYNAERARKIAAVNREYTGLQLSMLPSPGAGPDDTAAETVTVTGNAFLANPIFRLEWMGVYRFAAGQHASAGNAFARARALVVEQQQQSWNDRTHFNAFALGNDAGADGMVLSAGDLLSTIRKTSIRAAALRRVASDKDSRRGQDEAAAVVTAKAVEFHPEAMRLDRCTAVAICRQGPEAF